MTCGCPGIAVAFSVRCGMARCMACAAILSTRTRRTISLTAARFYGCPDEARRFTFFSKAALEFLLKSNRRPDIIHCHDWQTGIVPVLLFEMYNRSGMWNQRVCYTIHNFKHQGVTTEDVLWATGLGRSIPLHAL